MADEPISFRSGGPEDRRRDTMADWRRRSRLVARARQTLPIAIGVLLLAIIAAVIATAILGRNAGAEGEQTTIRMMNPRFLGRDEAGQAFLLVAREAVRIEGANRRIRMADPVLTLQRESVRPTLVTAQEGDFDEVTELLRLRRRVVLDSPSGRFTTEDALVDPNKRSVVGSAPIQGVGPTGNIAADRYALYEGGERVVFTGNVRARLLNGSAPPAGTVPPPAAPGEPTP